jgi:protein TonB
VFAGILEATPKIAKRVFPKYPDRAKDLREQGLVRIEFLVGADGLAHNIRVISGPPILQDAAVESVKQSKYEPAKKRGKPVPFAMVHNVTFRLN